MMSWLHSVPVNCHRLLIAILLQTAIYTFTFGFEPRPNVLLICVDDLRPELNCYGVDYIHSPHIDALASDGCMFTQHYVQAPTCGASRYALLTGCYGSPGNDAIFKRAKKLQGGDEPPLSLPAWFRQHGYTSVSVGKVSHHPGGRGGANWDDDTQPEMPNSWDRHLLPAGPWQHPRGWMHGLANGEIRNKASDMDLFQSEAGDDSIYPDGIAVEEALRQLELLSQDSAKPFFLAVGILRPHLPFGAPKKYMSHYTDTELPETPHATKPTGRSTWHSSGEFMKYNRWGRDPNSDAKFAIEVRKHYAACVSYADAQVGRVIAKLKELDQWDNTIVVLWGDHGWHLGEHAIWGKHSLFEESLRSPLIIRVPGDSQNPKTADRSNSIVESVDVYPSLCELADLPVPSSLAGNSLMPVLAGEEAKNQRAISYSRNARTIRTPTHRLIAHKDGYLEIYDHTITPEMRETINIASESETLAAELLEELNQALPEIVQ